MYPGDAVGRGGVFDAVACLRIVFHDLAGADAARGVDLVEDDGTVACDAEAVLDDERFDLGRVEERGEKGREMGIPRRMNGALQDFSGDGVDGLGWHRGGNPVHLVHPGDG